MDSNTANDIRTTINGIPLAPVEIEILDTLVRAFPYVILTGHDAPYNQLPPELVEITRHTDDSGYQATDIAVTWWKKYNNTPTLTPGVDWQPCIDCGAKTGRRWYGAAICLDCTKAQLPETYKDTEPGILDVTTLTDNELAVLRDINRDVTVTGIGIHNRLEQFGLIQLYDTGDQGLKWYRLTAAGRDYLATLASEQADVAAAAHKPFTEDDMKMWTARLANNYIGYMVQDDECCPGAVKTVMADIASLVTEVKRQQNELRHAWRIIHGYTQWAELSAAARESLTRTAACFILDNS